MGTMRRYIPLVAVCVMIICALGCHRETERDKVKKVITNVQKAAEEKNVKKIINSLSRTYNDPQGYTYDTIKGLLLGYFFRHQGISVYITSLEVSVEDASAKAVFQAVLTGRNKNETATAILPDSLGMYAFEVSLKKESGEWKVFSAKWERVGEKGGS